MARTASGPKSAVEAALTSSAVARILGVHPRTLQRHRAQRKRLSVLETQREEKLGRIWRELSQIYRPENAAKWLRTPSPVLQDRCPLDVMADDGGLDRVLDVIGRMNWGIPD